MRVESPACSKAAFVILAIAAANGRASAQELEPRAYGNAPVGLNFLIAGYAFTEGGVVADPSIPLTNADIRIHSAFLAYARSFGFRSRSAKFDVVLPYAALSGTADVAGQPREREVSGLGDARVRLSMNLHGAPALTLREMPAYRQKLIVGASLQVGAPIGQYDSEKVVNLGSHRWTVKPELGMSKVHGQWTFELAVAVTLFGDNEDFLGQTREQDPIHSLQGGVVYNFPSRAWLALSATRYAGGRTTIDGERSNDLQENSRLGITLSVPVNRYNSIKLSANTGLSTRTGSDFDAAGIVWQYRWGAEL